MTHACQCHGNDNNVSADVDFLTADEREAIAHETEHYEEPRAATIEALKIVQKARGWVPDPAIGAIAQLL